MMHDPVTCERDTTQTMYMGGGWKSLFRCPTCERESWEPLTFRGRLVCSGKEFTKEAW